MSCQTLLQQAQHFREVFQQESLDNISRYGFIKQRLWDMQLGLIKEEVDELMQAAGECFFDPENEQLRLDLVKELSDVVFVCYQFAAAFNIDLDRAMALVYESNLSKLDEQGKPIFREDGKVLKGPNYIQPNLDECIPEVQLNYYDTNGK